MKTNVKVTAKEGKVIIPSESNLEYGYIRVEQEKQVINEQGFLAIKPVSALVKGKVADLAKLGWSEGQTLEGNIIIRETTKQPFEGAEAKKAGADGNILTSGGSPIYRDALYDPTGEKKDTLVQHDAVEEAVTIAKTGM